VSVLNDERVCEWLRQAWQESAPGTSLAHEEGGFIVRNVDGSLTAERWPRGLQSEILVPAHPDGQWGGRIIEATFHTHPNTGAGFQQEPSLTDVRAVRDDPNLRHPAYEGELVISSDLIYRVLPDGSVEEVGATRQLLRIP
jgi:hypothetical protein